MTHTLKKNTQARKTTDNLAATTANKKKKNGTFDNIVLEM